MKRSILVILFTFLSSLAFSQTTIKSDFKVKLSCSQKYGLTTIDGDFVLTVTYDDNTIGFNTSEGQTMTSYTVAKKTDKYIIRKDESGNYAFYDIKKKQFFYIDYFMSRYTTAGYGAGYSDIKQTILKMMDLLKDSKTQKDVIQHLINQTEYDF
ncbi:hypothetical protein WAF17_01210 [Bernardetia sp. ABR2-2B]|uniref:hypothetical protein n=1 Tax=Bernardetia sp. ABR2-2B TaxID=3127472 RepID=UPI0030D4B9BD